MKNTETGSSEVERLPHGMVLVLEEGKEVAYNYNVLLSRLKVAGLIRIPEMEFEFRETKSGLLSHFNLGRTNHQPGKMYLYVRIIRNGSYRTDTTEEKPPLLSLEGARRVRCVTAENNLSIDTLTPDYFEYSLKGISDAASLKALLLKRYRASNQGLTESDIQTKGGAYTLLEFI